MGSLAAGMAESRAPRGLRRWTAIAPQISRIQVEDQSFGCAHLARGEFDAQSIEAVVVGHCQSGAMAAKRIDDQFRLALFAQEATGEPASVDAHGFAPRLVACVGTHLRPRVSDARTRRMREAQNGRVLRTGLTDRAGRVTTDDLVPEQRAAFGFCCALDEVTL